MSNPKSEPLGCLSNAKPTPIFPFFMQIPYYVREQIWESAIVGHNTPRIHYYSLYNIDDQGVRHSGLQTGRGIIIKKIAKKKKPIAPPSADDKNVAETPVDMDVLDWPIQTSNSLKRRPRNSKWARENRFHYYWSSGLLTACSESRFIFLRRYKKLLLGHDKLTIAKGYDGQKEVQMHVDAIRDILCLAFSPEDLDAAAAGLKWDVLLASMPFFPSDTIDVVNIAFEFDSTWNDNLPSRWRDLRREPSHRGLCASALWSWAQGGLPSNTRVWLIDRTWKPPPEYNESWRRHAMTQMSGDLAELQPKKFIDGNLAYMESKEWWDESAEFEASASTFVWRLREWYDNLAYKQAREANKITSWRTLPWNSPFCVAGLHMVPVEELYSPKRVFC